MHLLPLGVTKSPVVASIAFHALLDADRSAVGDAALLSWRICNSPCTRRRPVHHSHTFPFMSQIPARVPSWLQVTGPVPVATRAVRPSLSWVVGIALYRVSVVSLP